MQKEIDGKIRQNRPLSGFELPDIENDLQLIALAIRYRRAMRAKTIIHQTVARQ